MMETVQSVEHQQLQVILYSKVSFVSALGKDFIVKYYKRSHVVL